MKYVPKPKKVKKPYPLLLDGDTPSWMQWAMRRVYRYAPESMRQLLERGYSGEGAARTDGMWVDLLYELNEELYSAAYVGGRFDVCKCTTSNDPKPRLRLVAQCTESGKTIPCRYKK